MFLDNEYHETMELQLDKQNDIVATLCTCGVHETMYVKYDLVRLLLVQWFSLTDIITP